VYLISIAREIPCTCMDKKKSETQQKKVAMCFFCMEEFLKEKMLRCKGCNQAQYCSKECRIKAWPTHKEDCRSIGASLALAPAPAPAPILGSLASVDKLSDVDAEE